MDNKNIEPKGFLQSVIAFCIDNQFVVILMILCTLGWGVMVAPFDWNIAGVNRSPVPVDAIPDIGENQQIVFTKWMGRSPQDIEDQISYPLTVSLLGVPGVKTIRSSSMLGFSQIFIIFKENVDFYWSRSRVLEKLSSLAPGTLPEGVRPTLGPDATALGQIFWYTLEGRDEKGNPAGGWDPSELRSIQDFYVRYALMGADGISEVASVGGFEKEYQIDIDPDAMKIYKVSLAEVVKAIKNANVDVGAKTIEINRVEYVIRGIGFFKSVKDVENSVIKVSKNVPIYVKNIAHVSLGPASRRGVLNKAGIEAVGGVVVARYGDNPLAAINHVKEKIKELAPGLPSKKLKDGRISKVTVVPFYDRSELIKETLGTLNSALSEEILVTVIVVLVLLMNLKSSFLISGALPLVVLMCFIAMKTFHVDANIVALSGIAIAIGTIVDMGIVVTENILKHIDKLKPGESIRNAVFVATNEVGSAVITAVATTVISFLPVFTMEAAEGKLFRPLAMTKTFALMSSIVIALTVTPSLAIMIFGNKGQKNKAKEKFKAYFLAVMSLPTIIYIKWWVGLLVLAFSIYKLMEEKVPENLQKRLPKYLNYLVIFIVTYLLSNHWLPLGPEKGILRNFALVAILVFGVLYGIISFKKFYRPILTWALENKGRFLLIPSFIVFFGMFSWLGFDKFLGWLPNMVKNFTPVAWVAETFPGAGKEFMPPLDEGAYLYMPTTMPHASISESSDVISKQNKAITQIPEVRSAVGKLGRADSPLDSAPISMIETVINYHPKFLVGASGHRHRYDFDPSKTETFKNIDGEEVLAPDGKPYIVQGKFLRDKEGKLVRNSNGYPFRLWRPELDPEVNPGRNHWKGIQKPDDIWKQIVDATKIPGTTSAPKLQPISARIVMLSSGMRAPMGIKVKGPTLEAIEKTGIELERLLKEVPSVQAEAVFADRIVGKPYLEINIDRNAIARYGIMLKTVQDIIEIAIGGKKIGNTVEGRERYPIRVRYPRELRDNIEALKKILVTGHKGIQIPLGQLSKIKFLRGPQVIKSEDTFLVGYVLFDKKDGSAEVDVVEDVQRFLNAKIKSGEFVVPKGVNYTFAGNYENQIRSEKKLALVLPIALFAIFLILYLQFNSFSTTGLVFSGILVAWSGGFILVWLYSQSWFLNFSLLGINFRELFQIHTINLSVAVWVGFLALFGIASDDGVIIATYLDQKFEEDKPSSIEAIRQATIEGGLRRIEPALMTIATTILALIPVLTSSGRGSDVMLPMAIPSFGGMMIVLITVFVVPTLYCLIKEMEFKKNNNLN